MPSPKWTRSFWHFTILEAESQAFAVAVRHIPAMAKMDHEAFRLALIKDLLSGREPAPPRRQNRNELYLPPSKHLRVDLSSPPPERLNGFHPIVPLFNDPDEKSTRLRCRLCSALRHARKEVSYYCAHPACRIALCVDNDHWNMWHNGTDLVPRGN